MRKNAESLREVKKSGSQSDESPLTFILSTSDVDRVGDIVDVNGIDLTHFRKNPVALFGHSHNLIIGTWSNIRVEGKRLLADLKLAAQGTSRIVDEIRSLVEQRILKAVSIGFSVKDYEELKDKSGNWLGYHFTKSELHEASVVAVPANAQALRIKALSMNLSEEVRNIVLAPTAKGSELRASTERKKQTGELLATQTKFIKSKGNRKMGSISEQIIEKRDELAGLAGELEQIQKRVEESEEELSDDDLSKVDSIRSAMEAAQRRLTGLEAIESAQKVRAQAGQARSVSRSQIAPGPFAKERAKGDLLIKQAVCAGLAGLQRRSVHDVYEERYKHDDHLRAVVKSATNLADTATAGWAAELIREDVQGFLQSLEDVSIFASLRARGIPLLFDRYNKVTVPYRANTGSLSGDFVGELGTIPVKQGAFASVSFEPYHLKVITPFSEQLAEQSSPEIEIVLRESIRIDTAEALDARMLDGAAAVTGVRPASIINGVAGTASAGTTLANINADISALAGALITSRNVRDPVIIMNPAKVLALKLVTTATGGYVFRDELAQNRFLGYPLLASTHVPDDQMLMVDAANFASAGGVPRFKVSDDATLVMTNADGVTPSHAGGADGVGGTAYQVPPGDGIPVNNAVSGVRSVSMYQVEGVALRMVLPVSWGFTRAGSVNRITGVAY